jgi:hypothetical protein
MNDELASLYRGFRERYLSYDELTAQVQAWASAFPDLVRLESIGTTPEGRELWLLTIGRDPDRIRPALWVDGNMHAVEVAGSSVALALAEQAIALHLPGPCLVDGSVREAAQDALFHVLPRMSPDGAEAVLTKAGYVRSVPRDGRTETAHPRWITEDVDGDGVALTLRKEDPTGDFVEHPELPGLMLPRTIEDPGPYYKVYPEGHIANFDGSKIPDPGFLSDNYPDLNRNFPWEWRGEPRQVGAGSHPGSEPEARAVIERAAKSPHLFAWSNLHTFGGVMIRPPGDEPDSKMCQADLALYRQLEQWSEELCGYPMVSGYAEFLYQPEQPVRGALAEWAYVERGCLAWVTELWDLFARIGMKRPRRFVDLYSHLTRADLEALARWDREHNRGRVFRPFVPFTHPQLGEVEVGGIDTRVGVSNPPYELLPELCEQHCRMLLRVAAMTPRVVIAAVRQRRVSSELTWLEVEVENRGYLPTHGVHASADKPWNEPLWADVACEGGVRLEEPGEAHQRIGHLQGWGRGRFDFGQALFFQRSRGSVSRALVRWLVRGEGEVVVKVGSSRVGHVEQRVRLAPE